jgi:hypothetical protein
VSEMFNSNSVLKLNSIVNSVSLEIQKLVESKLRFKWNVTEMKIVKFSLLVLCEC